MKKRLYLYVCITCFFLAFLITMASERTTKETLAARIAPELLRFHVLANSDSNEDQNLKLGVRTELLDFIYDHLGENASLEETKTYVEENKDTLEQHAISYMTEQGYEYTAKVEVTNCYFPTKTYGDMVFPCGYYDAVRVILGEGQGRNWWCVLYPPLCFLDSTYAVVPDTSKEILRASLGEADYDTLLQNVKENRNYLTLPEDRKSIKIRPRFKIAQLLP